VPLAMALVSAESPRHQLGRALGTMQSAISLGSAAGPLIAGLAVGVFGLRGMFVAGGVLAFAAAVPVMTLVKEAARPADHRPAGPLGVLGRLSHAHRRAIVALIATQALVASATSAYGPVIALRILQLDPAGATRSTAIAFTSAAAATALGAWIYGRMGAGIPYRRAAAMAGMVGAGALVIAAASADLVPVLAAVSLAGLANGVI